MYTHKNKLPEFKISHIVNILNGLMLETENGTDL